MEQRVEQSLSCGSVVGIVSKDVGNVMFDRMEWDGLQKSWEI